jgi:hypothetical protein|tara:strand:+ start:622 stop:1002 length:381 start_codon:yes stop_codon:yes gene_type:complete
MLNKIKYFSALLILSVFSISAVADNVSRPGANNKMGLTKKTQEEKDNSFINKLIKGEYDGVSINRNEDLDQIKSEIADLKKQKEYSLNSNDKIIKQIKMLSNLKDEGILTEQEFNDKKKLLLDKLK